MTYAVSHSCAYRFDSCLSRDDSLGSVSTGWGEGHYANISGVSEQRWPNIHAFFLWLEDAVVNA